MLPSPHTLDEVLYSTLVSQDVFVDFATTSGIWLTMASGNQHRFHRRLGGRPHPTGQAPQYHEGYPQGRLKVIGVVLFVHCAVPQCVCVCVCVQFS